MMTMEELKNRAKEMTADAKDFAMKHKTEVIAGGVVIGYLVTGAVKESLKEQQKRKDVRNIYDTDCKFALDFADCVTGYEYEYPKKPKFDEGMILVKELGEKLSGRLTRNGVINSDDGVLSIIVTTKRNNK